MRINELEVNQMWNLFRMEFAEVVAVNHPRISFGSDIQSRHKIKKGLRPTLRLVYGLNLPLEEKPILRSVYLR